MAKKFQKVANKLGAKKVCLTPGAYYNTSIHSRKVNCSVTIPFDLDLTEDEVKKLEDRIHDAMESVLAKYWKQK